MDELYKVIKDDETRASVLKYLRYNGTNIKWNVFQIVKDLKVYDFNQIASVIHFTSRKIRCVAKFLMRCLEATYEGITWIEGKHRERFIFINYNNSKIIYGAAKAYQML